MPALEPPNIFWGTELPEEAEWTAWNCAAMAAPPLVLPTEVTNVPPPPGRASIPSLVAAPPLPPPLGNPVAAPVVPVPIPAAVAAPNDDTEDDKVIVGDLANEEVGKEMISFIEFLGTPGKSWNCGVPAPGFAEAHSGADMVR